MKQVILTKFIPTNEAYPNSIQASHEGTSIMHHYDSQMNLDQNHYEAACRLAKKKGIFEENLLIGGLHRKMRVFVLIKKTIEGI